MKTATLLLAAVAGLAADQDKKCGTGLMCKFHGSSGGLTIYPEGEQPSAGCTLSHSKFEEKRPNGSKQKDVNPSTLSGTWSTASTGSDGSVAATYTATDAQTGFSFQLEAQFATSTRTAVANTICADCISGAGKCRNNTGDLACYQDTNGDCINDGVDVPGDHCTFSYPVRADELSYALVLSDWGFAAADNTLTYTLTVSPPKGKTDKVKGEKPANSDKYSLELEGATVTASTGISRDGQQYTIAAPTQVVKSNQVDVNFVFPSFNNQMVLDPSVGLSPASWIVPSIGLVAALVALF